MLLMPVEVEQEIACMSVKQVASYLQLNEKNL